MKRIPVSLWIWPLWREIVDNELHRSQYYQTPPLHHHLETATASTEEHVFMMLPGKSFCCNEFISVV